MKRKSTKFEWFKLENYDAIKDFKLKDWCNAITNRVCFQYSMQDSSENDISKALEYWSLVRKYGVELNHPPEQWDSRHKAATVEEVLSLIEAQSGKSSVEDITDWNVMAGTFERPDIEEILSDWNAITGEDIAWLSIFKKGGGNPVLWEKRQKLIRKYKTLFAYEGSGAITINLSASDEQLQEDFSNWLAVQRSAEATRRKTRITERDFDVWREAKVLQYFDLIVISEIHGDRIPNHVMGDLLFPDEVDVDVAERVRKVTKRKAEQVFCGETVDILHAQK